MGSHVEDRAHEYLINKGCLSMGQTYTAHKIEQMLVEFTKQELNILYKCLCPRNSEDDCDRKEACETCKFFKIEV